MIAAALLAARRRLAIARELARASRAGQTACQRHGCGHPRDWHAHYRYGTDCSSCSCPEYVSRLRRSLLWPLG